MSCTKTMIINEYKQLYCHFIYIEKGFLITIKFNFKSFFSQKHLHHFSRFLYFKKS